MRIGLNWAGNWRKLLLLGGVAGVATASFIVGRTGSMSEATAAPQTAPAPKNEPAPTLPTTTTSGQRVVGYIYGTMPVTREEFGEYLMRRYGDDQLDKFVNRKIIDQACKERGIVVTEAEITAGLAEDCKGLGVNLSDFVKVILKQRFHVSLYEWREDVIRQRIALGRMCRDRVKVTEDEVRKGFEAYYGEKVECKMIMWPAGEEKAAWKQYADLRKSDEEFDRIARAQANPTLAAAAGRVDPLGRNTTGNEQLEKTLWSLKPGEVSELIQIPAPQGGVVVAKLIRRVAKVATKKLEDVRPELEKEIADKKLDSEIKVFFRELKKQAEPNLFVKRFTTEEDLVRDVEREIGVVNPKGAGPKSNGPVGN